MNLRMEPTLEPIFGMWALNFRRYSPSTLVWRKGKWYVQVTKPKELQFGSDKQSRRSTGTSDKHEARFLQHQLTQEIFDSFDDALQRTDPVFEVLRPILEGEGVRAKQWYDKGLIELTVRGDKTLTYKALGVKGLEAGGHTASPVEKWVATNHVELLGVVTGLGYTVPAAVLEYLSKEDRSKVMKLSEDGPSQLSTDMTIDIVNNLPKELARRMLDLQQQKNGVSLLRLSEDARAPKAATLSTVLEDFLESRNEKSREGDRIQLQKWLGNPSFAQIPLADVDHYDAYDFILEFDEVLAHSSIKVLRAALSNVFNWARMKRELSIKDNPFLNMNLKGVGKDGVEKRPFTSAELDKLFALKMSATDMSALQVLLVTGMRIGELLRVTEISEEGGIKYLDLRQLGLKTKGSRRMVPLHDNLTHLQFPLATSQGRLQRLIRNNFDDETVSLHSLRHTWKDLARDAGVTEEMHKFITGHSAGDVSGNYGVGPSLKVRHEAIMSMSFPWLSRYGNHL